MSLEVKHITKYYKEQKALDNVSFKVNSAEIVGFLGPNGAGKSTMMKILTTYIKASEGQAFVNGFDVEKNKRQVQQSVGYLPEHNPLYQELYVKEYLRFNAQLHKVSKNRIDEVLQLTGLQTEAHKTIKQLSKGYKQRVGLAAALLHQPDVLILDEPTTGLDPNQIIDIRTLIKNYGKEKTVFLSTHIMQEVEAVCDRVIIINKGKIVADKYLEELNNNQQIVVVEFDYRVEDTFLKKLPKVSNVKNTKGFVYEITFTTKTDMRPIVFDFAHDNALKIIQLHQKNASLEQLFRDITT